MDELAQAAGVAKGTLYLYFPSKEEVLLALHERGVQELFDEIDDAIEARAAHFTLSDLSALARRLIIESPIYLPLITQVIGFIGRSVPVESVIRVRLLIDDRLARSGGALEKVFGLPPGDGARLLEYSHAFVVGLWQLSGCGRVVAENVGQTHPELVHALKDEPAEIQRALEALWQGMLTPTRARKPAARTTRAKRKHPRNAHTRRR